MELPGHEGVQGNEEADERLPKKMLKDPSLSEVTVGATSGTQAKRGLSMGDLMTVVGLFTRN